MITQWHLDAIKSNAFSEHSNQPQKDPKKLSVLISCNKTGIFINVYILDHKASEAQTDSSRLLMRYLPQ